VNDLQRLTAPWCAVGNRTLDLLSTSMTLVDCATYVLSYERKINWKCSHTDRIRQSNWWKSLQWTNELLSNRAARWHNERMFSYYQHALTAIQRTELCRPVVQAACIMNHVPLASEHLHYTLARDDRTLMRRTTRTAQRMTLIGMCTCMSAIAHVTVVMH